MKRRITLFINTDQIAQFEVNLDTGGMASVFLDGHIEVTDTIINIKNIKSGNLTISSRLYNDEGLPIPPIE